MSSYLLIESRDPFAHTDVKRTQQLAAGLVQKSHQVTLLLVENGVFSARQSSASAQLAVLSRAGVTVLADEFSLLERGIGPAQLSASVRPIPIDVVIDHLENGHKVLWY